MTQATLLTRAPISPPPAPSARADVAEPELVLRARNGETEAREELARRCGRASYAFALQLCRDPDLAADVAQDSLLRFFQHLGRFDVDRPVIPWLFQIVRNRMLDVQRRARTRGFEEPESALDGSLARTVDRVADPDERAERSELRRLLWSCVAELDPPHREILVLRDYQDLSYRDISAILDIPLGTVMSRLHAARRRLRGTVLERGYDFGARP